MTTVPATPIGLIEAYFDRPLEPASLKHFATVTNDDWIDFAKHYLATMKDNFALQLLRPREASESTLRFYFEPRLSSSWTSSVAARYSPTPLFGGSGHPPDSGASQRAEVSRMLDPLKKHLLLADSVYVRDNFYHCFDFVADSVDRSRWRSDPNTVNLIASSVKHIKDWLPILIELRELIDSRSLVFMPYYLAPSFPYGSNAPAIAAHFKRLRMRENPRKQKQAQPTIDFAQMAAPFRGDLPWPETWDFPPGEHFSEDDALTARLNARILDLDPVFPNAAMAEWAASLYFDDGPEALDVTSDLMSIELLPFGRTEGIDIDQLISMRRNEGVFTEIRRITAACKTYIESNVGAGFTRETTTALCKTFLQDRLADHERRSVLRILQYANQSVAGGIIFSLAVGAAVIAAAPAAAAASAATTAISLIAGAVLTPSVATAVQRKLDPTRRAFGHLQTLL